MIFFSDPIQVDRDWRKKMLIDYLKNMPLTKRSGNFTHLLFNGKFSNFDQIS